MDDSWIERRVFDIRVDARMRNVSHLFSVGHFISHTSEAVFLVFGG